MPTASPARSTRSSSRQSGGSTPGRNASTPGGRSRATPRRRIAANADTPERSSVRNGDSRPGSQTPRGSQTPSRMIGSDPDVVPPSVPDEEIVVAQGLSSLALSEIDLSSPLNYGSDIGPGSRNTPIRPRPDVRVDRRMRQVNLGSVGDAALVSLGAAFLELNQEVGRSSCDASLGSNAASDGAGAPQLVIWGTDVVVTTSKAKFTQFLNTYTEEDLAEDEQVAGLDMARPYYLQRLEEIQVLEEPFLNLNCSHLRTFDTDLYRQLVNYPQEVIPIFDMATNELFFELYPETNLQHQIQVRPFNAEQTKNMRLLNPEDIDQLVTITGMVIRSSNLIPEMREAFFKCSICRTTRTVELDRGRIEEPVLCTNCNTNHTFSIQHNRSAFTDKQMVKLQESPEDMPAGQTPHTVILFAYNDMVDDVQPGDRVAVTGIYRATPVRSNPRQRSVKAVYKTHIDVVHFRKMDQKRLREENVHSISYFSEERVGFLRELSKKPDIYERLARAIAPSIYEHQDIKKGILLQLFGGTRKEFENTSHGRFRSEINILLCGDPGTSKSQLLQYVFNLVPRSQYTSGKGSSAVGLTAYVVRDPETKQLVMQTGALVLADNGVCCIDEFDKMSETTRSILHEVMENQTLSIAKVRMGGTDSSRYFFLYV
ncbi:unnamed protein product [Cyprideis torosa]|uniref:DNA replication licensing factor MCM4 n=1 Tax=Cyprideis torosa TaxID=163714 RepID=A0A7R8WPT6_9CRUS|nr:unnamed protein product [Cyprideis torosa]CAG0905337.1 unnamed protein product [Cyprideis torosa]